MSDRGRRGGYIDRSDRGAEVRTPHDDSDQESLVPKSIAPEQDSRQRRQALLTLLGSSLIYFAAFGLLNSYGFFQNYYKTHTLAGVSDSTISLIGTLQMMIMNVLSAPAGSLFDCYGLKILYVCSAIGCSLAMLGLSFIKSGSLWQIFMVQGVVLGSTIALGTQPALAVVGQHFQRRRGLVMGIIAAAGSIGGVCFPLILTHLTRIPSVGFAWAVRVVAVIIAACYAGAFFVSSTIVPGRPIGSWKKLVDFEGFLDWRYALLALGAFISMLGQLIPYYYIVSYTAAVASTSSAKDILLPLMNAGSLIGRLIGGAAADESTPIHIVSSMTILSGLLCLTTWAVTPSMPVLISFVSMYGFCSGVTFAVLAVVVAQLTPVEKLGSRIGAFYGVGAIAQLIGSPIGGALIRNKHDAGPKQQSPDVAAHAFFNLIIFAGATLLVGGLIICLCGLAIGIKSNTAPTDLVEKPPDSIEPSD